MTRARATRAGAMLLGVALRKDIFPFRVEMFMVKTACQLAKMGLRPPRRP